MVHEVSELSTTTTAPTVQRRLSARERWVAILEKYVVGRSRPANDRYWMPEFETASRSEIEEMQREKLVALLPYLYEHSAFYHDKLSAAKLRPSDIKSLADLVKIPITTKQDMGRNVAAHPPWGSYSPLSDADWRQRGWYVFTTSGTTAAPRPVRMTHLDRRAWSLTAARTNYAQGVRASDVALTCTTYSPHVFFWGTHLGVETLGGKVIPGGVPTQRRVLFIEMFKPTVLVATPSYALHLAQAMREQGLDPRKSSVKKLLCAGEPASGIPATRHRIEETWDAELHDYYGCTELAQAGWAHTCAEGVKLDVVSDHLPEDLGIWETVDPDTMEPVPYGERGLTVLTSLASEGSPQLRFLVGDFTVIDHERCVCARTLARARGGCVGRADDMLTVRGLNLFPSALEEIIRGFEELADEFQIVLERRGALDELIVIAETRVTGAEDSERLARLIAEEVHRQCELRPQVKLVDPGTLPKTEFKARRVFDRRTA